MKFTNRIALACALCAVAPLPALSAPIVFSGSGAGAATALDSFRAALGARNAAAAPQAGGRREIGWDGVRLDGTDANPNTQVIDNGKTVSIPIDRFRAQGAIFEDPYAVSGDGFASVNPGTAGEFPAFSPANTFVMFNEQLGQFDDPFIEQSFVLAGSNTVAGTRGFGAIFMDVENTGSSAIEFFGLNANDDEVSLGKFLVPTGASGEFQFLGVLFDSPIVSEVSLTVGTNSLFAFDGASFEAFGAENLAGGIDLAATDDFVFAEPTQLQRVPTPATLPLLFGGMLGALAVQRKRFAAAA